MKSSTSKAVIVGSLLAVAAMFTAGVVTAAQPANPGDASDLRGGNADGKRQDGKHPGKKKKGHKKKGEGKKE
jgi:hypothetical protein